TGYGATSRPDYPAGSKLQCKTSLGSDACLQLHRMTKPRPIFIVPGDAKRHHRLSRSGPDSERNSAAPGREMRRSTATTRTTATIPPGRRPSSFCAGAYHGGERPIGPSRGSGPCAQGVRRRTKDRKRMTTKGTKEHEKRRGDRTTKGTKTTKTPDP